MRGLFGSLLVIAIVLAGFQTQVSAESLTAPDLEAPKDKAKNQVATTVLKWKEVAGAKGYRVMVSLSSEGLNALAPKAACTECLVDQTVTAPTYQIPMKKLTKNAPYFWTVRALNDTDEGPSAVIRSYTLASTFFQDMD